MTDWIDIDDELPPLQKFVLTTDATINTNTGGLVAIARRIGHTPIWWCGYIDTFEGQVTHWLAFPKPPSEEGHRQG